MHHNKNFSIRTSNLTKKISLTIYDNAKYSSKKYLMIRQSIKFHNSTVLRIFGVGIGKSSSLLFLLYARSPIPIEAISSSRPSRRSGAASVCKRNSLWVRFLLGVDGLFYFQLRRSGNQTSSATQREMPEKADELPLH